MHRQRPTALPQKHAKHRTRKEACRRARGSGSCLGRWYQSPLPMCCCCWTAGRGSCLSSAGRNPMDLSPRPSDTAPQPRVFSHGLIALPVPRSHRPGREMPGSSVRLEALGNVWLGYSSYGSCSVWAVIALSPPPLGTLAGLRCPLI